MPRKKKAEKMKKLIVKRKGGYIQSVENPNVKNRKTAYLVTRGDFTGYTPVNAKGNRKIKGIPRGRTEQTAITNVLRKGYRKVEFRD